MGCWSIYIVECSDNTFYTGITKDVKRRITEHNNQNGAKYTKGRTPVELVYRESAESKSKALKREYEIKSFSRERKEKLIEN